MAQTERIKMKLPREDIDLSKHGSGSAKFWANYKSWNKWQFSHYKSSFAVVYEFIRDGLKALLDSLGCFFYSILMIVILVIFPIFAPLIALYNMKKYRKVYLEEFGLKELLKSRRKRIKNNQAI